MFILPQFQFFKWKAITSAAAAQVITYDPYFNYTSLLINAESTSTGSQNSTFIDSSTNNFSITATSTILVPPQQTSLSPYAPNDWGVYFSSGSRLSVPAGEDFAYGLGAFTIEAWINPDSFSVEKVIFAQTASSINYLRFYTNTSGQLAVITSTGAGTAVTATSGVLIANRWQHVALVREGVGSNQLKFYINGILAGIGTSSLDFTNITYNPSIGAYSHTLTTFLYTGYISNLRVVKGQALYTGNFTPSVSALSRTSVGATGNVVSSLTGTVSLLACQSNSFVDNSVSGRAITVSGSPRTVSFNPFSAYTNTSNSVYLNGTSSLVVTRNSAFLTPANTDFTIEAWVYPTATPNTTEGAQIIGLHEYGTNADWVFSIGGAGMPVGNALTPAFYMGASQMVLSAANTVLSLNTWNHIAVTRSGTGSNNIKLFVNGVVTNSASNNNSLQAVGSNNLCIGADSANNEARYTGYISNMRMVSGQGLYTGNFTPATTPLNANSVGTSGANVAASLTGTVVLLACQNPVVTTENSSAPKTITTAGTPFATTNTPFLTTTSYTPLAYSPSTHGGSVYFNSSNDLAVYDATAFPRISSNFTCEFWFYPTSKTAQAQVLMGKGAGAGWNTNGGEFTCQIETTNGFLIQYCYGNNLTIKFSSPTFNNLYSWNHCAFVNDNGTYKAFLNGKFLGIGTSTQAPLAVNNPHKIVLGTYFDGTLRYAGYISDFRYVNGTAIYTSEFTPPTAPLPAVAGTSLLLKANNGAIFDATNKNLVTIVGTASASNTVAKFGSKSMFFNGIDSYISISETDRLILVSGTPFTIEGWVYPTTNSYTSYRVVLYKRTGVSNTVNYGIYLNTTTGGISFQSGATLVTTSTPPTLNAWNHIAVTYDGSNISIYKDGLRISDPTAVSFTNTANSPLYFGYDVNTGSNYFQGYMDDFRITKGVNRYAGLSSFTIPTSAFPTQ